MALGAFTLTASLAVAAGASQAAASEPLVSGLSLIAQYQHRHGNRIDVAPQQYRLQDHHRRRLQATGGTLDVTNTQPLRIKLNFDSLEQSKAPPWSACFQAGDWFRRGFPTPTTPPSDPSQATCNRESESLSQSDCWGICLESDVITPSTRQKVVDIVTKLATEMQYVFRVVPTDDLTFTRSQGAYERALAAKGYSIPTSCAADCTWMSGVAVDDAYCDSGGPASSYDAVLSITKPPGIKGVAGTGSACATDAPGRPLWLVFAWHKSLDELDSMSVDAGAAVNRQLFRHELIHCLGFSNTMFNYAKDPQGQRKHLIELRRVVDTDGAVDDVWHFVKGRAYELAKSFFACDGNATDPDPAARGWDGLPLMGLPEAGRGAHWETRVMRDDVMSYGFLPSVSSITLAAMEDLGFYLANYSEAECMAWGFRMGCGYVTTRCGAAAAPAKMFLTDTNEASCRGDPDWGSVAPHGDLSSKCEYGLNPCYSGGNGYAANVINPETGFLGAECLAMCRRESGYTIPGCKSAPTSAVEGAGVLDNINSILNSIEWEAWLIPLIFVVCLCMFVGFVKRYVCPNSTDKYGHPSYKAKKIVYALATLIVLVAIGILAGTGYVIVNRAAWEALVNIYTIIAAAAVGAVLLLVGVSILIAVRRRWACYLRFMFWYTIGLVLCEAAMTFLIAYWIYSIGGIPADALNALFGDLRAHIDGGLATLLAEPVQVTEGLVCKAYQLCCRDPALDIMETSDDPNMDDLGSGSGDAPPVLFNVTSRCLSPAQHAGATNDIDSTLRDPSTPNFCAYPSGAPASLLFDPPVATCRLIETLDDSFSLTTCQANFCADGVDGYVSFLNIVVGLIQRFAVPLGIGAAVFVILQVIFACNLRTTAVIVNRTVEKKRMRKAQQFSYVIPS